MDKGEAIVKHLRIKLMYSSVLTKLLQVRQIFSEREALTGWDRRSIV